MLQEKAMKFKLLFLLVFIFSSYELYGQEADATLEKTAPKIFIDCHRCDIDYIRTEINFVNYVYDRKNADIHIMITDQNTGSGGEEYTLTFIGQNEFEAKTDTVLFTTQHDDTRDMIRDKMVKYLKMGLVPYIIKTPIADEMSLTYNKSSSTMIKKDNWNNWVFRVRLSGRLNGEKSSRNSHIYGRVSANRITEDWKIRLNLNGSYNEDRIQFEDTWYKTTQNRKSFYGLIVKSVSDHWAFGGSFNVNSDIYMNTKLGVSCYPAIEYNVFPYSESTRRELRIKYTLGAEYIYYDSETIFYKMEEGFAKQNFSISFEMKQRWGTVETDLRASNYLQDFDKNRLGIYSDLSIRLFKGFSINLHGGFSWIRDQIFLKNQILEKEDVLLGRYAMQTDYDYWGSIGFEYAFGSIFNNIVNPRFGN